MRIASFILDNFGVQNPRVAIIDMLNTLDENSYAVSIDDDGASVPEWIATKLSLELAQIIFLHEVDKIISQMREAK